MRILLTGCACVLASLAFAETLNIDAENITITVPANETRTYDAIVLADGIASNKVTITKEGPGKLKLPQSGTNLRTYFGRVKVNAGALLIERLSTTWEATFIDVYNDAGLEIVKDLDHGSCDITYHGRSGYIFVPEGVKLGLSSYWPYFKMADATVTQRGKGVVEYPYAREFEKGYIDNGKWIVEEGVLRFSKNNAFGQAKAWARELMANPHTAKANMVVEVREGAAFEVSGDNALSDVVLRGGTLRSINQTVSYASNVPVEQIKSVKGMGLNGTIKVLPSATPSKIEAAAFCYLAHGDNTTVFDVDDGAELVVDAPLYAGRTSDDFSVAKASSGFVKCGRGTLKLLKACDFAGLVNVYHGSLVLGDGVSFDERVLLDVDVAATIGFEGDAVLRNEFYNVPDLHPLLASADIWVDANRICAVPNSEVVSIRNLGRCGGRFERFNIVSNEVTGVGPNYVNPSAPLYMTNNFNGLNSLYFDRYKALCLNSYTNKGPQFTLFVVYRSAAQQEYSGPVSFSRHSATTDDYGTQGAFQFEHQAGASGAHEKLGYNFGSSGASIVGTYATTDPLFVTVTRNARTAGIKLYESDAVTHEGSTTIWYDDMNVDVVALGGRLRDHGKPIHSYCKLNEAGTTYGYENRMFNGHIGEMLVFSRVLTSDETAFVESYLKRKWFNSTTPEVTYEPAVETAGSDVNVATIDVSEGARVVLNNATGADARAYVKTGAGALLVGGAAPGKLDIREGALDLKGSSWQSKAKVWMDASDEGTVTITDDRVTAVQNKGATGGSFVKNGTTPCPKYTRAAMNGKNVLTFAIGSGTGNALVLDTYTNKVTSGRSTHIYTVFKTASWENSVQGGKWGGPFSCSFKAATTEDSGTNGTVHIEFSEKDGNPYIFYDVGGTSLNYTYDSPAEDVLRANLLVCKVMDAYFMAAPLFGDAESSAVKRALSTGTSDKTSNIDLVQIGGRLGSGGKSVYQRMWSGDMGEFILFDEELTPREEGELLAYLRKKWFDKGGADGHAPAMLASGSAVPNLENTELILESGTTLNHEVGTLALARLAAEDEVTWNRVVASAAPAAFALFNVAHDVAITGAQTLNYNVAPRDTAPLFGYGAACAMDAVWTLAGPKSDLFTVKDVVDEKCVKLFRTAGMVLILR